ncbi:MAG: SDR family oxidoreductase [Pseudomonadota bacterium]
MSKTLLITGATSGFGEATARRFASEGWKLVLLGRREERLYDLQETLNKQTSVHLIACDVRNKRELYKAFDDLPSAFQSLDVLVNNAGLALGMETADKASLEDWEIMVDTNIKGLMYTTHYFIEKMMQVNRGHIINMGSIAGNYAYPGANTYGATKAFVQQFSRNLLADVLGSKIKVTNLEPGLAESEFSLVRFKGQQEKADAVYKGVEPLTPKDIAETIYWVTQQPEHVNINSMEIMPVCQAWGALAVARKPMAS